MASIEEETKQIEIEIEGKKYKIYDDDDENYKGRLVYGQKWDESFAIYMAKKDGVDLTEDHWEVIYFVRDFFEKYQIVPMIKILVKEFGKAKGREKGNTKYLYTLFSLGPAKQVSRYAGLHAPGSGC